MLHNGTKILFDYWTKLKADREAPMRHEVSPAAISKILPSTFILQAEEDQPFEFRLAGTNLCLLFGFELKGCTFLSILDAHERRLAERLTRVVSREKTVLQMMLCAVSETGRQVYLECVFLPLGDAQPRILGAIHIMDMPYWVGAEQIVSTTIVGVRILDTERELISLHNRPTITMHDWQRAHTLSTRTPRFAVLQGGAMLSGSQVAQTSAAKRSPQLTVVHGGKD